MQTIRIVFCHPKNRHEFFPLSWTLQNHEVAFAWFKLFCQGLNSDNQFFTRFTGFTDGEKNLPNLMNSLHKCIDIINLDGRYHIPEKDLEFSQEFSNTIHHHFEVLTGSVESSTTYIKNSSPEVMDAVLAHNYIVHDMESYTRNCKYPKKSFAAVITEIRGCPRFKIPSSYDHFFSMNVNPGDLVAHYSQIGKTWNEVYCDKDEVILPEAILPLYALTGEFDIMFGKSKLDKKLQNKMDTFLISHGQNPKDPALRLGHLPLATINNAHSLSNREFKHYLSYYCDIKSIKATNNDQIVAERFFDPSSR